MGIVQSQNICKELTNQKRKKQKKLRKELYISQVKVITSIRERCPENIFVCHIRVLQRKIVLWGAFVSLYLKKGASLKGGESS